MTLPTAKHYAEKILAWLAPHCEGPTHAPHIAIAGSIRRERPTCNDIDIVCIPKVTETRDLLGGVVERENHLLDFLRAYVAGRTAATPPGHGEEIPRFISGGEREGKSVILQLPKCQLDIWFADARTWATRLLCRTGSKEHNIYLADRAAQLGGHWNPSEGLTMGGVEIPTPTEESLYAALGLEFISPQHREQDWIHKNLEFGL